MIEGNLVGGLRCSCLKPISDGLPVHIRSAANTDWRSADAWWHHRCPPLAGRKKCSAAKYKCEAKPRRLGHDYGRDQESLEVWVGKIVVNDDPRPRIATYPPTVQAAIREGKVMVGMTREQAIASIGYPLPSESVSLDAPTWRICRSSHGEYDLNFGADGRIKS